MTKNHITVHSKNGYNKFVSFIFFNTGNKNNSNKTTHSRTFEIQSLYLLFFLILAIKIAVWL